MLPGHWGLKGKTRERAKLEYELHGEELQRKLALLDLTGAELTIALAKIDYEYSHISLFEFKKAEAVALYSGEELSIALTELEHKEGNISDREREKQIATAKKEPWVDVVTITTDPVEPNVGQMELDWNEPFLEQLREHGYEGATDELIVDQWVADMCRNIAMEQFSGVGDFDDKVGDGFINKHKMEDGKWEAK